MFAVSVPGVITTSRLRKGYSQAESWLNTVSCSRRILWCLKLYIQHVGTVSCHPKKAPSTPLSEWVASTTIGFSLVSLATI
jgi:hypothetical protein